MKLSLAAAALAAVLGAGLMSGSALAHDYRYDRSSDNAYRGDQDDRRFEHRRYRSNDRADYGQYRWNRHRWGDGDDRRRGGWDDRGRGDRDDRRRSHRGHDRDSR